MQNQATVKNSADVVEMPAYEVPTIISYTDKEILEELGPAQANEYDLGTSLGF